MNDLQVQDKQIAKLFLDNKKRIESMLPANSNYTFEYICGSFMQELKNNPKLSSCSQMSVMQALVQCVQWGLPPSTTTGYFYLYPRGSQLVFHISYRGFAHLLHKSGNFDRISTRIVYENEHFECDYLEETFSHKVITDASKRGRIVGAYSYIKYKNGTKDLYYLDIEAINKIKNISRNSTWVQHFEEMAKKAVFRQHFKMLPIDTNLAEAITRDEALEFGYADESLIPDFAEEKVVDAAEQIKKRVEVRSKTDELLNKLKDRKV